MPEFGYGTPVDSLRWTGVPDSWRVAEEGERVIAKRCRCHVPLPDDGDCVKCGRSLSIRLGPASVAAKPPQICSTATWMMTNPCDGLRLPRSNRRRDRIASPAEAEALIAAVPEADRPLWATAMYAGLRRGEIQALRAQDADLATGLIHVEFGWDAEEGPIELKSNAGRRRVPIAGVLRDRLADQLLRVERSGEQLLFGEDGGRPFRPESIQRGADAAWKDAGLRRITFHECRHTLPL